MAEAENIPEIVPTKEEYNFEANSNKQKWKGSQGMEEEGGGGKRRITRDWPLEREVANEGEWGINELFNIININQSISR
jgi:hypothetical protein